MNIRLNITVFWAGDGYRARADELGIISAPFPRRRSAARDLKDKVAEWMRAEAAEGTLRKKLDDAGYLWPVGKDFIHVDPADQLRVSLPMPRKAFGTAGRSA